MVAVLSGNSQRAFRDFDTRRNPARVEANYREGRCGQDASRAVPWAVDTARDYEVTSRGAH